jgi:hypothetical protein
MYRTHKYEFNLWNLNLNSGIRKTEKIRISFYILPCDGQNSKILLKNLFGEE